MVAISLARIVGLRSGSARTLLPNFIRLVLPASAAIMAIDSRLGVAETIRSESHMESTPRSSHMSTNSHR